MAQNYCGLQIKDTVLYIKSAAIPFAYNPATVVVCSGDSVQFSASGGNQYQWEPSVYFSAPAASVTKAIVSTSQVYTLHITDAVCNRDTMINIPVTASSQADIRVTKTNDVSCSNDTAVLKATGGLSYTWMPNNYIVRTNSSQITVKPPQSITYYVTGIDALGCKGQDSITVEFRNEGDQRLFIPNAFSPNGDGLNDVFRPTFIGPAAKYQFSIYNRWGQLVFMSKVPGVGWNGVFQSKEQPGGVYVYYITAEGGCNGKFEEKGTFVLMR
jgi:gliding motility-associated-like protein